MGWTNASLADPPRQTGRGSGERIEAITHRSGVRKGCFDEHPDTTRSDRQACGEARDQDYADPGADYFLRRHDPERHASKLVRQLKALGYEVNIQPVEAA
ncbi:MAG TPA: hypothetical protein DIT48_08105 [Actinobacteria bacterium]|nr:hypothetical protein [Actinomycetota bacterium]HCP61829.1 hypothetical protein [Actinomycetota bacterium]